MSVSAENLSWSPGEGLKSPDALNRASPEALMEQIQEADMNSSEEEFDRVLFASNSSDSTYEEVKDELEKEGLKVDDFEPDDVEREDGEIRIKGKPVSDIEAKVYLRPKRWNDFEEGLGDFRKLIEAKSEGLEFYGDPQVALLAEDKKATKNVFRSKGVGSVRDFSYEEAERKIQDGEEIVVKPRYNSSCGDDVELVESEEEFNSYDEEDLRYEMILEEYIPQGSESENADMRMVLTGEESFSAERVNGDGVANNLSNGGEYSEAPEKSEEERYLEEVGRDILGEGFYSIDYIRESDGSVKVMEINSSSGTKINSEIDEDLYSSIAKGIRSKGAKALDTFSEPRIQGPAP